MSEHGTRRARYAVMTISHRVTRSRSSGSSVARENTTVDHNEPADPSAADEQRGGHLRGSAELPPIIPNEQDRPLIEPQGNS
ncbi:unnamed protein product [Miscanthus lutarioriparius]|uniref:Uncharacterized protein n=1 Tax=Miscanthus lutarioriparius TaxID=422564 RepID=A0A811RLA3_9POAL|nr:unnamed protein product [Miscanthus lutarioriparius]